ncbi:MAG: thermonuclease family protein [Phycisphaeraceae bacterium]|nr:thermonuclease family protein [Phycisphaeraceae bacterium]
MTTDPGRIARDARRLSRRSSRLARDIERAASGRPRHRRPDARARARTAWLTVAIFVVLGALLIADRTGLLLAPTDDARVYHASTAIVERVVDGDTVIVAIPDARDRARPGTRVRLWGIDAPELARDGARAEPFATDAAERLRALVEGRTVTLRLEPSRSRDRYGRLLAHLEIDDESVALALVREGLARAEGRWPHRDSERFENAQTQARRASRGIWSAGSADPP